MTKRSPVSPAPGPLEDYAELRTRFGLADMERFAREKGLAYRLRPAGV